MCMRVHGGHKTSPVYMCVCDMGDNLAAAATRPMPANRQRWLDHCIANITYTTFTFICVDVHRPRLNATSCAGCCSTLPDDVKKVTSVSSHAARPIICAKSGKNQNVVIQQRLKSVV
jgi:hypothetical protein